jgi:DMATS type aromatic prenyltransferase
MLAPGDSRTMTVDGIAERTLVDFGAERLAALCSALGVSDGTRELRQVFRLLVGPWGQRPIGASPVSPSNVADDGAPYEFCVAFSQGLPEIQVYVDPRGEEPSPASNLARARAILEAAANELGAPLERLRRLEDLFLPASPGPPFGLWVGASCSPGSGLRLKAYVNPHVRGRDRGVALVTEAMRRLGLARAWNELAGALQLNDGRDEVGIVSLDLSRSGAERIKLYVRHHLATVARIAGVARLTGEHDPSHVAEFYSALAESSGPFQQKPAATVFAFVDDAPDRPRSVALEFPIGAYVDSDDVARQRIAKCMEGFGLAAAPYEAAIRAFATRPLELRAGIHAHVTLRRVADGPRLAVYFASEAYARKPEAR